LTLTVTPVASGIDVAVDRQLLAGAVVNLLQNAFKLLRVRDIPGVGCVFSVGLPRLSPD
jgi:hypothetical protein